MVTPRWDWFGADLASLFTLIGWSAIGHDDPSSYCTFWIWIRVALEMTTLGIWFVSFLRPSFRFGSIPHAPEAFISAGAFALMAKLLCHLIASPWENSRAAMFKM